MAGQVYEAEPVIVKLPVEIDLVNAAEVRDLLYAGAGPGVAVVVSDLTSTAFCDLAGFREIVAASKELATTGVELRLAVPPGNVRRNVQMRGLDQAVRVFPSVADAAAGKGCQPVPLSAGLRTPRLLVQGCSQSRV